MVHGDIISRLKRIIGRKDLVVLFVVALLIRLAFLMVMRSQVGDDKFLSLAPDTVGYVAVADDMMVFRISPNGGTMIFGPGYGFFLALCFFLFGKQSLAIIVVHIILGAVNCLLISLIGENVTGSRRVGIMAGLISAVSFTAISLSAILLSETFFFFLFALGNLLFLRGLKVGETALGVVSGLLIGLAALTRGMVQFWPVVMVIFAAIVLRRYPGQRFFVRPGDLFKRALIAPLIASIIIGAWMARNYHYHHLAILSGAGPHGIGRLTAVTQARLEHRSIEDVYAARLEEYRRENSITNYSYYDEYSMHMSYARRMLAEHPWPLIQTYLETIRENVLAQNELYYAQLPRYANRITDELTRYRRYHVQWLTVFLTMLGFFLMVRARQWTALIFLGALYLYFVIMVGLGMWQGSRLFYPAQLAWSIAVAFLFMEIWHFIRSVWTRAGRVI